MITFEPILLDVDVSVEDYELDVDTGLAYDAELETPINVTVLEDGSLPLGGNPKDILVKQSEDDFDAAWEAPLFIRGESGSDSIVAYTPTAPANANTATGDRAVAINGKNTASGADSFAHGWANIASGNNSYAEGSETTASGSQSHSEGRQTTASGTQSHSAGYGTTASGVNSHAEGYTTEASGTGSHSEGYRTTASGHSAHAEGSYSVASGNISHAEGERTIANHRDQHAFGKYNIADDSEAASTAIGNYIEIVGNGTSEEARSNARTLDWGGNEVLAGKLTLGSAPENSMDAATKEYVDAIAGKYTHEQTSASATWTITHNLGRYPSVTVVDSAGTEVVGDVQYVSDDQIICTFAGAFSGVAYLN